MWPQVPNIGMNEKFILKIKVYIFRYAFYDQASSKPFWYWDWNVPGENAHHDAFGNKHTQRAHDAIITPLWRQNDVATSFWRNNDVIIASCVRWAEMGHCAYVFFKRKDLRHFCAKHWQKMRMHFYVS